MGSPHLPVGGHRRRGLGECAGLSLGVDESDDILEIGGAAEAVLTPGDDRFTFGRSATCSLCMDTSDVGISRVQGALEYEAGHWWLSNLSRSRPLTVVPETGLSELLATESRRVVDQASLSVVVTGEARRHILRLHRPRLVLLTTEGADAIGTATSIPVMTPRERFAIVALVEGYLLDHPRHDPRPRTYQEIADRLGLPRSTVMKRIENTRKKMMARGVAGLDAADARTPLAEFVLTARLVSRGDLADLERALAEGGAEIR